MSASDRRSRGSRTASSRDLRSARHLLWTLPLGGVLAWLIAAASGVVACGVSSCSGGGLGPVTDLRPIAAVMMLASGAALSGPLYLVRWTRRRSVRLTVAVTLGVGWALLAWLEVTDTL